MTEPAQKPGKSKQDYGTPRIFLDAVEKRFGVIRHDLAASAENAVCADYFDEARNSLVQDWSVLRGTLWLNPPFGDIGPWAKKLASVRHRRGWTCMLVPASIGTEWYSQHAHDQVVVLGLSPRIKFVGAADAYPKDLALMVAGFGMRGFDTWRWDGATPLFP